MLFIEIAKLELTGGHIRILLFIEIENLQFNSMPAILFYAIYRDSQIKKNGVLIILFMEIENLKFHGGHIKKNPIHRDHKTRINERPYWKYTIYRDRKTKNFRAAILKLCYI